MDIHSVPFIYIGDKIIATKDISMISKSSYDPSCQGKVLFVYFVSSGHTEINFKTQGERDREFERLNTILCKQTYACDQENDGENEKHIPPLNAKIIFEN